LVRSSSLALKVADGLTSAIPTITDGGNHTPGFEQSAASIAAHYACLDVSKALASTGVRVLIDDGFFMNVCATSLGFLHFLINPPIHEQVQQTFKDDEKERGPL
jgi:hypothetical protein